MARGGSSDEGGAVAAVEMRLSALLRELTDDAHGTGGTIGSTYALEIPFSVGVIHLLHRLDDGDRSKPKIVAAYLDRERIDDIYPELLGQIMQAAIDAAPWLYDD